MTTTTTSASTTTITNYYKSQAGDDLIAADNDRVVQQVADLKQCFTALRLALNTFLVATSDAVFYQWRQPT